MRQRALTLTIATLSLACAPAGAGAASFGGGEWNPVETLDLVRGEPRPQVSVYPTGSAVAVYSSAVAGGGPRVRLAGRSRGGAWRLLGKAVTMAGRDARVATSPDGTTAIAAVDDGQLRVAVIAGNAASGNAP